MQQLQKEYEKIQERRQKIMSGMNDQNTVLRDAKTKEKNYRPIKKSPVPKMNGRNSSKNSDNSIALRKYVQWNYFTKYKQ